ncbi:MAG: hypothetical protein WAM75_03440, partial [Xanthobacteraceae bacterium]
GSQEGGHEQAPFESGQETAPAAEELTAPTPTEPELKEAVADLDAAPHEAALPSAPEPLQHPVAPAEPTRRRSTIRERAPMGGSEENLPPPQTQQPSAPAEEPVVTQSSEAAESALPRRTGWWSRRFAGG